MIPRVNFAHLPTPVEPMPRLGEILNIPNLYVKRDDQTGLAFGGNKTRKLEFLLADALSQGSKTLITTGAIQSNHCRQTAAAAAKFGLECTLILVGESPEQPSANLFLDKLFGANIVWVNEVGSRDSVLDDTFNQAKTAGKQPYLVPYGGSNPTGALGYVFAMQEFLEQKIEADWIVFASSSGGTQAGLVLGSRVFGFKGRLLGISVDGKRNELTNQVADLAARTSQKLGHHMDFSPESIYVNDSYCSTGYGNLTNYEIEAIHLFARTEGLLLDPVYTGRAAAGFIDLVHQGFFKKNDTVIFWHTGGQPAIFAPRYRELIDIYD